LSKILILIAVNTHPITCQVLFTNALYELPKTYTNSDLIRLPAAEASGAPDTKQQHIHALLAAAISVPGDQPTEAIILLGRVVPSLSQIPASAAILAAHFWSSTTISWEDPFLTIARDPIVAVRPFMMLHLTGLAHLA
jgi:hypothetical protein